LAMAIMMQGVAYGGLQPDEVVKLASEQALEAVAIDPNDADAQAVLAFALWTSGNFKEAWERATLAITSNPNSPWANGSRGALLIFSGYPVEGRAAVLAALRLSPLDPRDAHLRGQIAISHYFECDYAGAVEMAKSAMSHHPEHPMAYRWLAAALGQLDRADDARDALKMAIQVSPESFQVYTRSRPAWIRTEDYQHMLDGLRKAGWQR
jgi:adenylate cyclase